MESGIQGVESGIQQCLGFLFIGQRHRTSPANEKKKTLQTGNRRKKK